MLPPPCFTVKMLLARWWVVPGFFQIWRLPFRPKSLNCLMVWESFRWLLANSRVMCLLLRCGFSLATLPNRPDWWSAVEMVVLSTETHGSSVRVAIGFLVTSLTKTLLPRSLSLARWPALGRVLLIANFFLIRIMEATVLILCFNAAEVFLYPSTDLCLDTILPRRSKDNSLDFMAWFVLWHALLPVGPYINRCVNLFDFGIRLQHNKMWKKLSAVNTFRMHSMSPPNEQIVECCLDASAAVFF